MSTATTDNNSSATTVNRRRYSVITEMYEAAKLRREKELYALLSCVRYQKDSPVHVLGKDIFRNNIAPFVLIDKTKKPTEQKYQCKVTCNLCTAGTEHVWTELCERRGTCSLSNDFMGGPLTLNQHADWLRETRAYTFTNSDGSYWNEAQLRRHFLDFLEEQQPCGLRMCGGLCHALPGSTLVLGAPEYEFGHPVATGWQLPSQEELADREWLHGGGVLSQYCQLARDDPSQLDREEEAEE